MVSKEFLVLCPFCSIFRFMDLRTADFWSFVLHCLHSEFTFSRFVCLDLLQSKLPSAVWCPLSFLPREERGTQGAEMPLVGRVFC